MAHFSSSRPGMIYWKRCWPSAKFWLCTQCSIMHEGVLAPSFLRLNQPALPLVKLTTDRHHQSLLSHQVRWMRSLDGAICLSDTSRSCLETTWTHSAVDPCTPPSLSVLTLVLLNQQTMQEVKTPIKKTYDISTV